VCVWGGAFDEHSPVFPLAFVLRRIAVSAVRKLVQAATLLNSQSQSQIIVMLQLMVSQSVCLGVEPQLGLMTRCFFLYDSYCPVHVGRLL
jgi:hypothetical protein